jgi:hypothetical protein
VAETECILIEIEGYFIILHKKERNYSLTILFPKKDCIFALALKKQGSVVQLVRIRACHARGRGFESRPDRKVSQI